MDVEALGDGTGAVTSLKTPSAFGLPLVGELELATESSASGFRGGSAGVGATDDALALVLGQGR